MTNKIIHLSNGSNDARNLLADLLNNADEYETVVVVAIRKTGVIDIGHTAGGWIEKAGLISLAQVFFVDGVMNSNGEESDDEGA